MCSPIPSPTIPDVLCLHCQGRKPHPGGRGLCFRCYNDRGIRALYPRQYRHGGKTPPCRHCHARAGKWSRGLCAVCFRRPEVLAMYPPAAAPPLFVKGHRLSPARPDAPQCVHCRDRPISRPRELCWGCFYDPAIRGLYASKVSGGSGIGHGGYALPEPTSALPGTEAKIIVFCQRAAAKLSLFHDDDAE